MVIRTKLGEVEPDLLILIDRICSKVQLPPHECLAIKLNRSHVQEYLSPVKIHIDTKIHKNTR